MAYFLTLFWQVRLGISGSRTGMFNASLVRLSATRLRNFGQPPAALRLADFGLLHRGCPVPVPALITMANGSVTLRFDAPVAADGYYLVTSDDMADSDPVSWVVEIIQNETDVQSNVSDVKDWHTVGASVWHFSYAGIGRYYPHLPHDMPDARRTAVFVDHRRTWLWALASVAGNGLTSVTFLACSVGGMIRQAWTIVPLLIGMLGLRAVANVVAAVGFQVISTGGPLWISKTRFAELCD